MKICRFDENRLGILDGETIRDVTDALDVLPPLSWPAPHGDHLIRHLAKIVRAIEERLTNAPVLQRQRVRLLSPVANPSKIIAAPLNYAKHVDEAGKDVEIHANTHAITHEGYATPIDKLGLFLKSSTSMIGEGEGMTVTYPERRTDHEVELCVIIGREGKNIAEADAVAHIAAYCIGLDMTVRGPEDRSFRKSPDGYAVLGPSLVTADEIGRPEDLQMSISVNDVCRQSANTRDLIVPIPRLIAIASSCYRLYPGDIIMTGTPDGVASITGGDRMVATIAGVGRITVDVRPGHLSAIHGLAEATR